MNEFNLSDKELKALLQNEGLEEPSLSFNRLVLEKAEAYEKSKAIFIPLWTKILFALLVIAPMAYVAFSGELSLGMEALDLKQPDLSFNFELNSTYQYISLLTVGVIWMAYIFNKFLTKEDQHKVKNG